MSSAHSRSSSASSDDSFLSGRSRSPTISADDSTAALILLSEDAEGGSNAPFDFSDDDDDFSPDEPLEVSQQSTSLIPPLPPSAIFLYLLSPYLSLGALLLPSTATPLKYGLGALILFAALSAFVRQIWYMLARYMRTTSMEDVVVDAFARGRGKERARAILRISIRLGTGLLRVLLATMFLRFAVDTLLPLLPDNILHLWTRPTLVLIFALTILPLSYSTSLADKRLLWVTWMSVATFTLWLGCVWYAHARGTLAVNPVWLRRGSLWEGITVTAFAFTSGSTLPLYASLKGAIQPISTTKTGKWRSFRTLSPLSVGVATVLMLPLVFFSPSPNRTEALTHPPNPLISVLSTLALLFRIPSLTVTTPPIPIPIFIQRSTTTTFQEGFSKGIMWGLVLVLGLITSISGAGDKLAKFISALGLIGALSGTYLLPAILHIITHHFKRPLSIVIPNTPLPTTFSPATPSSHGNSPSSPHTVSPHSPHSTPPARYDELLQQKERALQRRRLVRRIIWDIGVWVLLVPLGGGGIVWGVGRLVGGW